MGHSKSDHGGVKLYWIFCVILCAITFLEWLVFDKREAWNISKVALVSSLSVMSLVKFTMVVGWYMHLRYDPKILKQIFIAAFVVVMLLMAGLFVLLT